jgi:hypothetical protein
LFFQTSKEDVLDELVEHVRARIQSYFPDIQKIGQVRVTHSIRRSYSNIHCMTIYADGQPSKKLIIKISETGAQQFVAMKSIWPQFEAHATWKIPRPLDYLPEDSALVMEEVSGISLAERLPWVLWIDRNVTVAEIDCTRIGEWLRYYHDVGKADKRSPVSTDGIWPGLNETLAELSANGFDTSIRPLVEEWVVPLAQRALEIARPVSFVHGDFTADNVMIDGENVVVVDLCAALRNSIDLDIAAFLNSLLLLRLTRPVPWSAIDRMRNAFLSGYFKSDPLEEIPILFLQGMGLADVALEIVRRRRSPVVKFWIEIIVGGVLGTLQRRVSKFL